jgi:hypothetical protein
MKNIWVKRLVWGAVGAGGGYLYYAFVGCATGSCPITSNPYISTAYGAMIGVIMTMGAKRRRDPRTGG